MATLCARPTEWDSDRRPVAWCPDLVALGSDYCLGHEPYPATDRWFEDHLRAREAAA